ncbi:MAG TPA: hypothetical protein VNE71_12195 [Myxococcota bacterium]|nr:hypothetical protein [Myxococcota bacterium]
MTDEGRDGDRELDALLDALRAPAAEPHPALVARTLAMARAELRARPSVYWRELARLAAPAAAGLPLWIAVNAAVVWAAWLVLSAALPAWAAPLAIALPAIYAFGAVGWLGVFFGTLPFVAHQRLVRRLREVPT